MFVDFVIFVFVAKAYKYKKKEEVYETKPAIEPLSEKQGLPSYDNISYSDENYTTKF